MANWLVELFTGHRANRPPPSSEVSAVVDELRRAVRDMATETRKVAVETDRFAKTRGRLDELVEGMKRQ